MIPGTYCSKHYRRIHTHGRISTKQEILFSRVQAASAHPDKFNYHLDRRASDLSMTTSIMEYTNAKVRLLEHTKQITDIVTRVVENLGTLREPQTLSVVNRLLSSPHWQFGYDESESKKHYSINIYRTAIGYYRYVLGRGEGDHVQEQYEPFMWYEPSHDTVRNVFDAAEETCARLVTENVHNERRRWQLCCLR